MSFSMLVFTILACQDVKRVVSEIYPLSYEIPVAEAAEDILEPVVQGLVQPTDLVFFTKGRLFIAEKSGSVRSFIEEKGIYVEKQPFLSVPVRTQSEQGLLGIAFHPEAMSNGLFYTHHTPKEGAARGEVVEWSFDPTASEWKAELGRLIFSVEQPYANHNGGQIQFGPDGLLYIGLGDGGWRDDPHGHGQNKSTLLGSIIRIDPIVEEGSLRPYSVPKDNPFADSEIFMYGLRNPWRFSFLYDGRLIVGDVGQNAYEEISIGMKGANLGWNRMEGNHCFPEGDECDPSELVPALWEYPHSVGQSITGGVQVLNNGPHHGAYLFGDFTAGKLWALQIPKADEKVKEPELLGTYSMLPVAFGRSLDGDAYVADFNGTLYRLNY